MPENEKIQNFSDMVNASEAVLVATLNDFNWTNPLFSTVSKHLFH